MSIQKNIQALCLKLGDNNKATYAVMAIALCKGILRPTFTMHDKKQDPKTKKYAAFREGVTEMVAFPSYFIFGKLSDKLAPKLLDEKNVKDGEKSLTKELRADFDNVLAIKKQKQVNVDVVETQFNTAINKLGKDAGLFKKYQGALRTVNETSGFVGVCIAALLFIPSMCNVVMPPVMNAFKKMQDKKKPAEDVVKTQPANTFTAKPEINKPLSSSSLVNTYLNNRVNSGMRVGN